MIKLTCLHCYVKYAWSQMIQYERCAKRPKRHEGRQVLFSTRQIQKVCSYGTDMVKRLVRLSNTVPTFVKSALLYAVVQREINICALAAILFCFCHACHLCPTIPAKHRRITTPLVEVDLILIAKTALTHRGCTRELSGCPFGRSFGCCELQGWDLRGFGLF